GIASPEILRRGRRGRELPPGGPSSARRPTRALEADSRPRARGRCPAVRAATARRAGDARGGGLSPQRSPCAGERRTRGGVRPAGRLRNGSEVRARRPVRLYTRGAQAPGGVPARVPRDPGTRGAVE